MEERIVTIASVTAGKVAKLRYVNTTGGESFSCWEPDSALGAVLIPGGSFKLGLETRTSKTTGKNYVNVVRALAMDPLPPLPEEPEPLGADPAGVLKGYERPGEYADNRDDAIMRQVALKAFFATLRSVDEMPPSFTVNHEEWLSWWEHAASVMNRMVEYAKTGR